MDSRTTSGSGSGAVSVSVSVSRTIAELPETIARFADGTFDAPYTVYLLSRVGEARAHQRFSCRWLVLGFVWVRERAWRSRTWCSTGPHCPATKDFLLTTVRSAVPRPRGPPGTYRLRSRAGV